MDTDPQPIRRRDMLLMTGLATAGALAATRPSSTAVPGVPNSAPIIIDVREHGAKGDGSTDDSVAVTAALNTANSQGAPAVIHFPQGDYRVRAGVLVVPDGTPMILRGDGPLATTIGFVAGDTGSSDLITLDAAFSGVEDLQLDGSGAINGGDLLVMNRGYNRVSNCYLSRSPGTALAIGKTNAAIAHIVENTLVRDAQEYGIRVHAAAAEGMSGSTDGLWSNVDVGRAGLSGVFLQSSSQNLSNVHVWQSGIRSDDDDNAGFRSTSRSHIFIGCQSEKNLGHGFLLESGSDRCVLSGCRVWENGRSGLMGTGVGRLTVSGSTFTRNGRSNIGESASSTAPEAAAIVNRGGDAWAITGCSAWDDTEALEAVTVPDDTGTVTLPARPRQMTQTFAYAEIQPTGSSVITGGVLRAEDHLSGHALKSAPALRVTGADLGDDAVPTVEAATTIELPAWADVIRVVGTTPITAIAPGREGHNVTLTFVTPGSAGIEASAKNVQLAASFTPQPYGSITVLCVSEVWRESGRSA